MASKAKEEFPIEQTFDGELSFWNPHRDLFYENLSSRRQRRLDSPKYKFIFWYLGLSYFFDSYRRSDYYFDSALDPDLDSDFVSLSCFHS